MSGDSRVFDFTVKNGGNQIQKSLHWQKTMKWEQDGVVVDITNYTIEMKIRVNSDDGDVTLTLSDTTDNLDTGINKTDPTNGVFRLQISDTDTAGLEDDIYFYDIVMTDPNGLKTLFLKGSIEASQTSTR